MRLGIRGAKSSPSGRLLLLILLVITAVLYAAKPSSSGGLALASGGSEKLGRQEAPKKEQVRFELLAEGRLMEKDSVTGAFHNYRSDDGVFLQRKAIEYRSDVRAREEMQRMINTAAKMIDRGSKLEGEGSRKGERAVLLWRRWRAGEVHAVVLWTDGPELYILESRSLRHVLAFERQVYQHNDTIPFRRLSGGKLDQEGVVIEVSNYETTDGMPLQQIIQRYRSPSDPGQEMQRIIARAASVVERGPKRDREGRRIGERAVLMLGASTPGQAQMAVVWTEGSALYLLQSSSLRHVLAFEKQVYPSPSE